ncbi:unnamed protein product [Prorocentrum cordatum]|uniref:Uncharacterized protein n=1 Tax=Prorocentrum cordatum TaxID=2364126 RepID=A0ABN9PFY9_9DINO|nr:unnamed protein product [Polarella glacialis]
MQEISSDVWKFVGVCKVCFFYLCCEPWASLSPRLDAARDFGWDGIQEGFGRRFRAGGGNGRGGIPKMGFPGVALPSRCFSATSFENECAPTRYTRLARRSEHSIIPSGALSAPVLDLPLEGHGGLTRGGVSPAGYWRESRRRT